jgi:FAD/FMN-containing dehydrogenase
MKKKYINFNKLFSQTPTHYYEPKDLTEYQKNITAGKDKNEHIRVFGSAHVFNDITISPDIMVNIKKLNKVLEIELNKKTITVEAGIKLYKLLEELKKYNLVFPILTATSLVSVGGVIATGAHGSNIDLGSICNNVIGGEIVLYNGKILKIKQDDNILLKALRCNLGCLGGVYSLTLQCEELFYIKESEINMSWNEFYKNINSILTEYSYTQVSVDPYSVNLDSNVLLRKKVNNLILEEKNKKDFIILSASKALTYKYNAYYIENEMAFPFDKINIALLEIVKFHLSYAKKYKIKSKSTLLIRFSNADDSYISMASNRKTVYISSFFGKEISPEKAYEFFYKLSVKMSKLYKARPHYGKIHNLDVELMKSIYPEYNKFRDIKNYLDPHGYFVNDYINRIFF